MSRSEIDTRIAMLSAVTPMAVMTVPFPEVDEVMHVHRPESIDPLLDDAILDPEQNLPYWAEIWPSGVALASVILREPELVRGLPVLELGCGIGITAAAAMRAGARLTATDYSPHSLRFTELTCLTFGESMPATRQLNWRAVDADLLQENGSRWPVVLAADVLYEERDIEPVLDVFERIISDDGMVLLAEPGRRPSKRAVELARERGWSLETSIHHGPWPDPKDADEIVSVHRMQR